MIKDLLITKEEALAKGLIKPETPKKEWHGMFFRHRGQKYFCGDGTFGAEECRLADKHLKRKPK